MHRNVLYRIFNSDGDLLYVGATTNPAGRFGTHQKFQPWWDEAAEIKLEQLPSFEELCAAEVAAIQSEDPRYNLRHSRIQTWSRKPHNRKKGTGTLHQRSGDGIWIGRIELPSGPDGKRRFKYVSSMDRDVAEAKLDAMIEELRPNQ